MNKEKGKFHRIKNSSFCLLLLSDLCQLASLKPSPLLAVDWNIANRALFETWNTLAEKFFWRSVACASKINSNLLRHANFSWSGPMILFQLISSHWVLLILYPSPWKFLVFPWTYLQSHPYNTRVPWCSVITPLPREMGNTGVTYLRNCLLNINPLLSFTCKWNHMVFILLIPRSNHSFAKFLLRAAVHSWAGRVPWDGIESAWRKI